MLTDAFFSAPRDPKAMVVLKEEAELGSEPGPAAAGTGRADLEGPVLQVPRPQRAHRLLLLLHVATVVLAPDDFELDSRQVLGAATLHKDDVVLLQVVALPGDKADGLAPGAEPDAAALAVGRVGLLGLADERAQNNALQLRPAFRGTQAQRGPLWSPHPVHLVQCSHGAGGPELGY